MVEVVGERAGGGEEVSEGVVGVCGHGGTGGVEVARDVAVVVVAWDVDVSVALLVEQPADAARALQCA